MRRLLPRKMPDLLPAACAAGDEYLVFLHLPDSTEQYLLPDLFRKFIMFLFITERSGHAAAAGGDLLYPAVVTR